MFLDDVVPMEEERVVYKYELDEHAEYTEFQMPGYHQFLTAQVQVVGERRTICVWAEVDPKSHYQVVSFRIVGTGGHFDAKGWHYIDTVQLDRFVWHVYANLA